MLRRVPAGWRWVGLAGLVAVAVTLVWLLFLRDNSGPATPVAQPTPQPRPAAGRAISFGEYSGALDRAHRQVQRAQSAKGDDKSEATEAAAVELLSVEGASASNIEGGGVPAEIDNSLLIAALQEDDPDLAGIEKSLQAALDSLDDAGRREMVEGTAGGEEATSRLKDVLSDPAFNYERGLSPLQQLARWLASLTGEADPDDTLWRFFLAIVAGVAAGAVTVLLTERWVPNRWARLAVAVIAGLASGVLFFFAVGALNVVFRILGVVGLVVAAIAAALFVLGLRRGASAPAQGRRISELAEVLGMGAADARARAEKAAGEGDYRSAVRYRSLAVLLVLDEAGMLIFDRTATNREYLFRAPGDLQAEIGPLLARFDAVWYGGVAASEADWREHSARAAGVEARVLSAARGVRKAA